MAFPYQAYWAGVGTVVIALAGGFSGGVILAERFSNAPTVPPPRETRLAQAMSDYQTPRPVAPADQLVNSSREGAVVEEKLNSSNSIRESVDIGNKQSVFRLEPEKVGRETQAQPAPVASPVRREPSETDKVEAPVNRMLPERKQLNADGVRGRPREEPSKQISSNRPRFAEKREKRETKTRRASRSTDNRQYTVMTLDGRKANSAEVERLKAILRARRSPEGEMRMSYQPEAGGMLGGLFRDED